MDEVLVRRFDSAIVITFNRPDKLNAITRAMTESIASTLDTAMVDASVRTVIITGTGDRAFSAGADLQDVTGLPIDPDSARGRYGFGGLARHPFPKPIIAAVNGLAYGGGAEAVLRCDFAIAAPHASFAFPEVARGLIAAGGGAIRLARTVGSRMAAHMLLTAQPIDAPAALGCGLVSDVQNDPLSAALELSATIARNAPLAIEATLRLLRAQESEVWAANDAETAALLESADVREGAAAFLQRRAPHWQGR